MMSDTVVLLAESEAEALRSLIRARGKQGAALALEIHPTTLATAAAGAGVMRTTASYLRERLRALDATNPK
jgi:hypothetical protein